MDFIELKPGHEDIVNDLAFNYYGKRLASCSSDRKIKVWTLDERKQEWFCEDVSTRAHQDSVWRLSWAHPEFGQMLASCSEDGTVKIWAEQETFNSQINWVLKATLSDSKKPINDVKFANRGMGLYLATASMDGYLRFYEARSPFDPTTWTLEVEHFVDGGSPGADGAQKAKPVGDRGLTCISWNDCPFEPDKIAVGTFSKGAVIYSIRDNRIREECILNDQLQGITDIAWAPSMGRSFHSIATATKENHFKIHKVSIKEDGRLEYNSTQLIDTGKSAVWRVAWNATGTVLVTSAEDGVLTLWRKNFSGNWISVQTLPSDSENKMSFFYSTVS